MRSSARIAAACLLAVCACSAGFWLWQSKRTNTAGWLLDPNAILDADSRELRVFVTDPDCPSKLEPKDVDLGVVELNDAVVLTARTPKRGGPFKASLVAVPIDVTLAEALGNRSLLDGRFDPPAAPRNDFNSGALPIPATNATPIRVPLVTVQLDTYPEALLDVIFYLDNRNCVMADIGESAKYPAVFMEGWRSSGPDEIQFDGVSVKLGSTRPIRVGGGLVSDNFPELAQCGAGAEMVVLVTRPQ